MNNLETYFKEVETNCDERTKEIDYENEFVEYIHSIDEMENMISLLKQVSITVSIPRPSDLPLNKELVYMWASIVDFIEDDLNEYRSKIDALIKRAERLSNYYDACMIEERGTKNACC